MYRDKAIPHGRGVNSKPWDGHGHFEVDHDQVRHPERPRLGAALRLVLIAVHPEDVPSIAVGPGTVPCPDVLPCACKVLADGS